jgi:uncharacterized protein YjbI with pentapeptide repeats
MLAAITSADLQGWIALVGGFFTAVLALLKYFDFRSKRERAAASGAAFAATVEALASDVEVRQLAGAILLRRFFDRGTEQGGKDAPYAKEAVGVMAAILRDTPAGTLQKLLADGLAFAPTLVDVDLQGCNLQHAYLGERPDREPDFSRADFFEADLSGASLQKATARSAVFYRATLRGTVLREAKLEGADFREAELEGANFSDAKLAGARFDNAKNVPAEIEQLIGDDGRISSPA